MSLKLSEAIRLGAMLKPQGTLWLEYAGKTCALGAALDAVGELPQPMPERQQPLYDLLYKRWPILSAVAEGQEQSGVCVGQAIATLNDGEGWTREQIAEWVEAIENQSQPVNQEAHLGAVETV